MSSVNGHSSSGRGFSASTPTVPGRPPETHGHPFSGRGSPLPPIMPTPMAPAPVRGFKATHGTPPSRPLPSPFTATAPTPSIPIGTATSIVHSSSGRGFSTTVAMPPRPTPSPFTASSTASTPPIGTAKQNVHSSSERGFSCSAEPKYTHK